MDDEAIVLLQLGNRVLDVSRCVSVSVFICNASDGAKERGSHLRNQLFLAVELISEVSAEGAI